MVRVATLIGLGDHDLDTPIKKNVGKRTGGPREVERGRPVGDVEANDALAGDARCRQGTLELPPACGRIVAPPAKALRTRVVVVARRAIRHDDNQNIA
jgi:hypothetical protein